MRKIPREKQLREEGRWGTLLLAGPEAGKEPEQDQRRASDQGPGQRCVWEFLEGGRSQECELFRGQVEKRLSFCSFKLIQIAHLTLLKQSVM